MQSFKKEEDLERFSGNSDDKIKNEWLKRIITETQDFSCLNWLTLLLIIL
jgi:hypothetical protein